MVDGQIEANPGKWLMGNIRYIYMGKWLVGKLRQIWANGWWADALPEYSQQLLLCPSSCIRELGSSGGRLYWLYPCNHYCHRWDWDQTSHRIRISSSKPIKCIMRPTLIKLFDTCLQEYQEKIFHRPFQLTNHFNDETTKIHPWPILRNTVCFEVGKNHAPQTSLTTISIINSLSQKPIVKDVCYRPLCDVV